MGEQKAPKILNGRPISGTDAEVAAMVRRVADLIMRGANNSFACNEYTEWQPGASVPRDGSVVALLTPEGTIWVARFGEYADGSGNGWFELDWSGVVMDAAEDGDVTAWIRIPDHPLFLEPDEALASKTEES